ncbi:2-oxoglutarate and Fe(II)-dependent oxygenase superfamily protein [Prunus dulcis]|uniref:2-oxoglutarate and Fe(II)-dependent oxygenase superfamily protein n=1 Tax=Prunus dulcis TaxID=3755 RepID=A0A5H2Y2G1_PRUDU|nr:2-oxoglutarate and Fe(II)-dependent oxygenase superfamily protein [Prunus dulcis]
MEPPSSPLPFPTLPRRRHGLCWPEIAEKRRELTETSRPPISLLRPPFPSTQAPG